MLPSHWEVLILKPTSMFLSFLSSQLPDLELPNLRSLQSDCTAYVIRKQKDDEETLNEIERHFAFIFKYEIHRCLGRKAFQSIEGSFLDFLCCFKFELHSQLIILEETISKATQLIRIRPRSVLLKWMRNISQDDNELSMMIDTINLSHLAENASVIIKNFASLADIKPFLKLCYPLIFEAEMIRMCENEEQWPRVDSYQAFCRYFAMDVHTKLIHLQ